MHDLISFQLTSITNNTPSTNTQSCSVLAPTVLLPPTQLIVTEYRILDLVNLTTDIQLKATWTPPAFNINLFDYYLLSVIDANNLSFFNAIIVSNVHLLCCLLFQIFHILFFPASCSFIC